MGEGQSENSDFMRAIEGEPGKGKSKSGRSEFNLDDLDGKPGHGLGENDLFVDELNPENDIYGDDSNRKQDENPKQESKLLFDFFHDSISIKLN